MRVSIDTGKCMGHGICCALAPSVYAYDDQGYGMVIGDGTVPADKVEAARTGAANYPESAISFQD